VKGHGEDRPVLSIVVHGMETEHGTGHVVAAGALGRARGHKERALEEHTGMPPSQ